MAIREKPCYFCGRLTRNRMKRTIICPTCRDKFTKIGELHSVGRHQAIGLLFLAVVITGLLLRIVLAT